MSEPAPNWRRRGERLPGLDALRGAALAAMFVYHLTWDFAYFGLIDAQAPLTPGMRLFSHCVASAFLGVAGFSLGLRAPGFDARALWRRWAFVAGAAALASLVSAFVDPSAPITFGILHCIALASVLALPFVRLHWSAAALAALVLALAPLIVAAPAFNSLWLNWTGFYTQEPRAADFRPLTPWAAPLFVGLALCLSPIGLALRRLFARWRADDPLGRLLRFGGRHSLIVYLVHQPVFFALIGGALAVFGAPAPMEEKNFLAACEQPCRAQGASASVCAKACACTVKDLKILDLWRGALAQSLSERESALMAQVAQTCARRARE